MLKTHTFQVSNLGTGDKCGVCGKTRSQHGPVEAAALHAGKVAGYKSRIRALERALADMLEEFGGYRNDNDQSEDWREPKVLQRARELLRRRAMTKRATK